MLKTEELVDWIYLGSESGVYQKFEDFLNISNTVFKIDHKTSYYTLYQNEPEFNSLVNYWKRIVVIDNFGIESKNLYIIDKYADSKNNYYSVIRRLIHWFKGGTDISVSFVIYCNTIFDIDVLALSRTERILLRKAIFWLSLYMYIKVVSRY